MAEDAKKKSIDDLLNKATAEKYGLGPLLEKIQSIEPFIEKVSTMQDIIKGDPGKTPVLGEDYLNEAEQNALKDSVTPKKDVDYFDGDPGEDGYTPVKGVDYMTEDEIAEIKKDATPVKGQDYFTDDEVNEFKKSVTPVKGQDYNDGENPTPQQFLEVIKGLKGADAASFSQIVGSKIDISHVRNAGSFIFNGKEYQTHELMHGGGTGGGGGGVTEVDTAGGITGGPITSTGTIQLATNIRPIATLGTANQQIRVNAGATALEYFTPSASGGVQTVVGTSNRITVDSTDPANPIVDIAATYVGQTSITTLGTITTGVWSGTTIAIAKGGTGQTTKAAAFDALSPMSASGDIIYGGVSGTGTRLPKGSDTQILTLVSGLPAWAAPATAGTVTSVSGTANRITSTGGTTPVIDISASYVGQSSITTLGTVSTGTWAGTTIALNHGGTGLTSISALSIWAANVANTLGEVTPSAGQSIRVNAGATAWEAFTPATGTVTAITIASANGFAGSSSGGATPALTISTSITGILKGNGTAISAATAGTDYVTGSSTNTFTNKTYDTAGTGNAFAINGTSISTVTGTGAVVLNNKPTFLGTIQTITAIGALALDGSLGNIFTKTIGTGSTFTQSNFSTGQNFMVTVSGAFTITWFSGITWFTSGASAPTQGALTTYGFTCTGSNTFNGYLVGTQ